MSSMKVYRTSRRKLVGGVIGCAAFAYAGTFMLSERPLLGWAVVLFFGAVAFIALVGLFTGGSSLRLGRKGFEISSPFKRARFFWDEIEPLEIVKIKQARLIAVNYVPGIRKQGVSQAMTGMDLAIGNTYNVSLQELCETMNEWRSRYKGADQSRGTASLQASTADGRPLASDVEPASNHFKPARPFLIAFCAALLVLVLNVLLRLMLKLQGMPVTMGIAFSVGGLVWMWFLKYVKRSPTPQERSSFLWAFSALIVIPYLALFMLGSVSRGFNGAALIILALHSLAYPAAAQVFLSENRFNGVLAKKA